VIKEILVCRVMKAQRVQRDPREMQALREALVQPGLKDSEARRGQQGLPEQKVMLAIREFQAMLEKRVQPDLKVQQAPQDQKEIPEIPELPEQQVLRVQQDLKDL